MINQVMVALDGMNEDEVLAFCEKIKGQVKLVKIGMELFYRAGGEFLKKIHREYGVEVFLDLKIYDIPNTAYGAIRSLEGLPIKFLTLHLQGGGNMLERAKEARDKFIPNCQLLGVTYLTSFSENDFREIWNYNDTEVRDMAFERLINLAFSRVDGIVCSAQELALVQNVFDKNGKGLQTVCPGIRFNDEIQTGKNIGDQSRVLSPEQALKNGASYLVMGRSLTKAQNLQTRLDQLK